MIDNKTKQASLIFHALGHPVRLAIVKGLLRSKCNVGKIVKHLRIPQSSVSQHLGVLKAARIIVGERKKTEICYRVTDGYVREVLRKIFKVNSIEGGG
jgi:ArsR family transcriptional regulator